MTHTPGPWYSVVVRGQPELRNIISDTPSSQYTPFTVIVDMVGAGPDADLICAAPELLSKLTALRDAVSNLLFADFPEAWTAVQKAADEANLAIVSAGGESYRTEAMLAKAGLTLDMIAPDRKAKK